MVFPYMHHDLAGLLENPDVTFSEPQIKCYMIQLLEGTKYLHQVFILSFFRSILGNLKTGIRGSGLILEKWPE